MTEKSLQKMPYPLGARTEGGGVCFSFVSRAVSCGILLYDRDTGRLLKRIPFTQDDRIGNIYCKTVGDIAADSVTYLFYEEERLVPDERARFFPRKVLFGKEKSVEDMKAGFLTEEFDWGQDGFPRIPYSRVVAYCMHVRGFTKHSSSGVKHKGTFAGIREKIPYLKEIGVTTVELQPAYEFTERPLKEENKRNIPYIACPGEDGGTSGEKLNYWGYKKGYYYVPKSAYAASENPSVEFKELVRTFHENHMELVMQFYFTREVKAWEVLDILRFWLLEYHVDGFHLMGEGVPLELLAEDDVLAGAKLWHYGFDTDRIYGRDELPAYPHVAEYNDSWYYDMRRFLKGDAGMLGGVLYHMRHIPEKAGCIHYMTNYYGFTLGDLVSYDFKHNESNGEGNRDGNDYNCSWNCGEEGVTRKAKVRKLRLKQIKNAMCMLLLSQSTPLIFMGDEFGNTQKGNNNPYCQDNPITWLDWNDMKRNAEILDFWKMLAKFRKAHAILRPEKELRLMDYIACGYPDLSYHGKYAWRPQTDNDYRHIGIMLCGKYAKDEAGGEDAFLYLGMNMHWENRDLALPRLPRGMEWSKAFGTGDEDGCSQGTDGEKPELLKRIPPRSIVMYIGVFGAGDVQEAGDVGIK